jgi:hypothetical protein
MNLASYTSSTGSLLQGVVRGRELWLVTAVTTLLFAQGCGGSEGGGWDPEEAQVDEVSWTLGACASTALPRTAALASSTENASLGAALAIDANAATRWSSAFADPQWLRIDLGAERHINRVVLTWETASSRAYTLDVSNDGSTWTTIHTQTNGAAGPTKTTISDLNGRGRYLRLHSTQRTTPWGVSLYELEVFGDSDPACTGTGATTYRIDSVASSKTLDVKDGSSADGATIQQATWSGGNNQKWIAVARGTNQYQLKSVGSGKCLDISGGSTADGAKALQWACHDGNNQRFTMDPVGNGQFTLKAWHSGKCLDVPASSTASGAAIQQWTCNGTNAQKWTLSSVSGAGRNWVLKDANKDGALNWSTTVSSGGSTIGGGNQWNDVAMYQDDLIVTFTHNGTGYAAANITSGQSNLGVEAQSQAERDAGKWVDQSGRLSFVYKGTRSPVRLKLVDSRGFESNSVKISDFLSRCSSGDCDADIPLSALAKSGFDFALVQSVTTYVDSSVPSGFYGFSLARMVFRSPSDPIDTSIDPENCGSVGHSCRGGACREGACQGVVVGSGFTCSRSMALDSSNFYVSDDGKIYRFNLDGSSKTTVASNVSYAADLVRDDNRLFWQNGTEVRRMTDAGTQTVLYTGAPAQLKVSSAKIIAYDYNSLKFVEADANGSSAGTPVVLADASSTYPMSSAATSTHLYFLTGSSSGTSVVQINRSTKQWVVVNDPTDSVFNVSSYGDTVYWSYRTSAGRAGIRRLSSAPGSTVQQAVAEVPPEQSVGNAYVDASGIYHSLYDGTTNYFWRTSHTDPAQHVLVSKTVYPIQSFGVAFTADSIFWHDPCGRYSGGTVQRLAKP